MKKKRSSPVNRTYRWEKKPRKGEVECAQVSRVQYYLSKRSLNSSAVVARTVSLFNFPEYSSDYFLVHLITCKIDTRVPSLSRDYNNRKQRPYRSDVAGVCCTSGCV